MVACVFCRVLSFKPPKPCRNPPTWWIQKSEWRMRNKDPLARMTDCKNDRDTQAWHQPQGHPIPGIPQISYKRRSLLLASAYRSLQHMTWWRSNDNDHRWPPRSTQWMTARLSKTRQEQKPHMTSKDMPTQPTQAKKTLRRHQKTLIKHQHQRRGEQKPALIMKTPAHSKLPACKTCNIEIFQL